MPKETFRERDFSPASLSIIDHANVIIAEYQRQGFTLTLRQLYYQFVSRDLLANTQNNYKRLGSIINDARLAGLIDWETIEDRTRNVRDVSTWGEPGDIIRSAAYSYREDWWDTQQYRPEVWIEKDALVGVIEPVCERYRVPFFACRGYSSQSEQWRAGKRFAQTFERGQTPIVFHLGDHDPSGIDMTRDNQERLTMFAGHHIKLVRLALNMDQVTRYRPPPNPAKETDSRASGYTERFGNQSWELDALEPQVIDDLIAHALDDLIDTDSWSSAEEKEQRNRDLLTKTAANWSKVSNFVEKQK